MLGKTYYERGEPVVVLAAWKGPHLQVPIPLKRGGEQTWLAILPTGKAPRNVVIQRADGTLVVRPFRGLRKDPPEARA